MSETQQTNLPAICNELGIAQMQGVPVVNSRDLAERFGKKHPHVLRDIDEILADEIDAELRLSQSHEIDNLKMCPKLDASWFRPQISTDSYGREQRSFDLTRDGFTLLVMGWTGEKAKQFKIRYILAFNEMEAALKARWEKPMPDGFYELRECVIDLGLHVERNHKEVQDGLKRLEHKVTGKRRALSKTTKFEHADAAFRLGGRCQCCGINEIISGGQIANAEYDHFYKNSMPNVEHTWLICKDCHGRLSTGRTPRFSCEPAFHAYQLRRRQLPGRQQLLL